MFINIQELENWIDEWKKILNPNKIYWYYGTEEQKKELLEKLNGTYTKIDEKENSYAFFSDESDVARMESRTFICSKLESESGKTNNWAEPENMFYKEIKPLLNDIMIGRTMYLIPFSMGSPETKKNIYGIEITDQPYVCLSMGIMTRIGQNIFSQIDKFIPCIHTSGKLKKNIRSGWMCSDLKYICHFPDGIPNFSNSSYIISYGSSYGGNALLSKKCLSLRIASKIGYKEGWLAEHCLIIKITSPDGIIKYFLGSFPSSCGKTNLAMCEPCELISSQGWKFETIGDDIAWIFQIDGQLYALNPENGFFGVAPGTTKKTNPNAIKLIEKDTIFTNVGIKKNNKNNLDIWWEGMDNNESDILVNWQGYINTKPIAHPNSRYTSPITNCPCIAKNYDKLVPISGIIYGGRRSDTIPLVSKATNYLQGIFYGTTLSSEETSASIEGIIGNLRFDPMAMKPFIGYNIDDYLLHWINIIKNTKNKPNFFLVNWFRKDLENKFIWEGFGSNAIVLKWIFNNCTNNNIETNNINGLFGIYPTHEDLYIDKNKWNKLFLDPKNKIDNYLILLKSYINSFDKFPEELAEIYQKIKKDFLLNYNF